MKTTYIDRANTNEQVIRKANETLQEEDSNKTMQLFPKAHRDSKIKRAIRTLNKNKLRSSQRNHIQSTSYSMKIPKSKTTEAKNKMDG